MSKAVGKPKRTRAAKNEPPAKRTRTAREPVTLSSLTLQDLNDDCLLEVFNCLDLISLFRMCKLNQRFKDIIMQEVIPRRTIDFHKLSSQHSVRKLFKMFGHSITRIIFHQSDIQVTNPNCCAFEEFLRLLIEHCEPGKLKEVTLYFNMFCELKPELLQQIGPYFENVQSLNVNLAVMRMHWVNANLNQFFSSIPKHNLRTLTLHNIRFFGDWLKAESFPNLKCLHVFAYDLIIDGNFRNFINDKPASLVEFLCDGVVNDDIFVELSRCLPNIERLGKIKSWYNENNGNNWNNRNNWNNNNNGVIDFSARWKYSNEFKNLKKIDVKSFAPDCSDCGELFRILGKHNTIEEIELTVGHQFELKQRNPVMVQDLRRLTRLKTLHVEFTDKCSNEFLDRLLISLPTLKKCTLSCGRIKQGPIINLVQNAHTLRVLVLRCKLNFSAKFYKTLLKIRKATVQNPEENSLVVHIENDRASPCLDDLGKKYKPNIVQIKPFLKL